MLSDKAPLPNLPEAIVPEAEKPAARAALWIAILFAGIAGNAGIALSPLLLSGMAQFLHFGDQRLGELAAGASVGSSLVALSAVFFMGRKGWPLRRTVIVTLCIYAIVNLAIPLFFVKPLVLLAAMFLGGCCSGMIWSAAVTALPPACDLRALSAALAAARSTLSIDAPAPRALASATYCTNSSGSCHRIDAGARATSRLTEQRTLARPLVGRPRWRGVAEQRRQVGGRDDACALGRERERALLRDREQRSVGMSPGSDRQRHADRHAHGARRPDRVPGSARRAGLDHHDNASKRRLQPVALDEERRAGLGARQVL